MGHLMEATQRIVEADKQRREELIGKAGAEALDDVNWEEQLRADEAKLMAGESFTDPHGEHDLPEGAEPLADVEAPPTIALPEIGTPVRYHARRTFMRRRQTEFPAFVLSQRPDEGTVDLFVMLDSDDTIVEERVLPFTEEEPFHCFAILGNSQEAVREEISKLWAEFRLLRAQVFGDYVEPPKSVMDYLADFEQRLAAATVAVSAPKGKSKKG